MNRIQGLLRGGAGIPLALLALLAMLVLPLPTMVLDLSFTFNIALSIVVLLVSLHVARPLNFAAFPTILLLATLLRLSLNVASTRVVLLNGHTGDAAAGQVIKAFGEFVIGGNYAVGFVVFIILVIINFVVITKGAGRIAEVSARFTLDAMPGKQMAIDADLNAGLLDAEQARQRREQLVAEADFYGSMDGASKFVRGDAIAGILILVINLVGGLAVGTLQHGLGFSDAAQHYALLTIGDGLVAQIPGLLLSVATAIIISRVSAATDVGQQIVHQLFGAPRVMATTAAILGTMALIPGMPNMAFMFFALVLGGGAWLAAQRRQQAAVEPAEAPPEPEVTWDDVAPVDVLGLEVGYRLISLVDKNQDGSLLGRIRAVRRKFSQELGFLVPAVHVRDNLELPPATYRLTLLGSVIGEAQVYPGQEMAINPGQVLGEIEGIQGSDPAYGMDAIWIDPDKREEAMGLGYTVVDLGTVIATHLSKVIQEHAHELLGREEVVRLLDRLDPNGAGKPVEERVPGGLSLAVFHRVLRNLLQEFIPIRDLRTIAEILADTAPASQDPDVLTAAVRAGLGRAIVQQLCGPDSEIEVFTLDPDLERILMEAWTPGQQAARVLEPSLAEKLRQGLAEAARRYQAQGGQPVLLVPGDIRQAVATFVRHAVQGLNVLAYNEIPPQRPLRVVGTVAASG